jgi:hypothetical protein
VSVQHAADPPELPWFEGPELEAYLERAGLDANTEAFVRSLARDGYALVDLGDEARALCDRAIADTERYFGRRGSGNRIQDAWLRSKAVRRLAVWPEIKRLLRAAYGREPFAFQTLNFQKGSQQALHPDTIHFHSLPERFMCGVWIALEDVKPGAGPLVYHPGSHRLPVMTMRDAGVNQPAPGPDQYESVFVKRFAERIAETGLPTEHAIVKKGWAFVWAANLAHGGSPVTEPGATRRSLVVHWYFKDCLYYTPMTSDLDSGQLKLRLPFDIATGGWVWPRRNGRAVYPGKTPLLDGILRRILRRPHLN